MDSFLLNQSRLFFRKADLNGDALSIKLFDQLANSLGDLLVAFTPLFNINAAIEALTDRR